MAGGVPEFVPLDSDCFLNKEEVDLDKYILKFLSDVSPFHEKCSKSLDILFVHVQNVTGLTVKRVVKGGSLGKGTSIFGHSDICLTLYLSDFRDITDYRLKLPVVLGEIYKCLQKSTWAITERKIRMRKLTDYDIQFNMECDESLDEHNVVLIPAFDYLGSKPKQDSLQELYAEMSRMPASEHKYYKGLVNQIQLNFVQTLPKAMKNFIRLLKHWMEICFDNTYIVPPYLVECVAFWCWERAKKPETFDAVQGLKTVFEVFANHPDIAWVTESHYRLKDYQDNLPYTLSKPYIVDPVNPFENLVKSVASWREIVRGSVESLRRPLLKNCVVNQGWKKNPIAIKRTSSEEGQCRGLNTK